MSLVAIAALAAEVVMTSAGMNLRMSVDSCAWAGTADVAAQADGIHVRYPLNSCVVAGTPRTVDVLLGKFPQGTYRIHLHAARSATPTESLTYQVVAPPRTGTPAFPDYAPLANYEGLWFDPAEPGWGVSLSNVGFGVMYAYFDNGSPQWLTLQGGSWTSTTQWGAVQKLPFNAYQPFDIYQTYGPGLAAPVFDPNTVATFHRGAGSIDFTDVPVTGRARFTFTFDSVTYTRSIQRLLPH